MQISFSQCDLSLLYRIESVIRIIINARQNRRIIDICHGDSKALIINDSCAIGYAIGETVGRVFVAIMGIADFSISNILLGKGATVGKINGHVIVCSKIPVIACVSCLFQRANVRHFYDRIGDSVTFNIGKLQISRRQCHSVAFSKRHCAIGQNRRIIDICHGDSKGLIFNGSCAVEDAIGETIARVFTAIMGIADFSISNILLGKSATGGKIIGHVIACSKILVYACASCLFQRANARHCYDRIGDSVTFNIGKLQMIRRQYHSAAFSKRHCAIGQLRRIISTLNGDFLTLNVGFRAFVIINDESDFFGQWITIIAKSINLGVVIIQHIAPFRISAVRIAGEVKCSIFSSYRDVIQQFD